MFDPEGEAAGAIAERRTSATTYVVTYATTHSRNTASHGTTGYATVCAAGEHAGWEAASPF